MHYSSSSSVDIIILSSNLPENCAFFFSALMARFRMIAVTVHVMHATDNSLRSLQTCKYTDDPMRSMGRLWARCCQVVGHQPPKYKYNDCFCPGIPPSSSMMRALNLVICTKYSSES